MKSSFQALLMCTLILTAGRAYALASPPAGFEDPGLMSKVMAGEIVVKQLVDTKQENRTVLRSYFNKVSGKAYADLAMNYEKYPSLFSEVKEAKTTKVSQDRKETEYWMDMLVTVGFFTTHVYPEGKHTYTPGTTSASEDRMLHELTNYKDTLEFARETVRLIPYETGILVESDLHVKLVQPSAQASMMKRYLVNQFIKYTTTFRRELSGNY